jgi:hypothetical protein
LFAEAFISITAMFSSGSPAGFFVVNAGTFFLGYLYPVWEVAYRRVSGQGLQTRNAGERQKRIANQ